MWPLVGYLTRRKPRLPPRPRTTHARARRQPPRRQDGPLPRASRLGDGPPLASRIRVVLMEFAEFADVRPPPTKPRTYSVFGVVREIRPHAMTLWSTPAGSSARLLVSHGRLELWRGRSPPAVDAPANRTAPGSLELLTIQTGTVALDVSDHRVEIPTRRQRLVRCHKAPRLHQPASDSRDLPTPRRGRLSSSGRVGARRIRARAPAHART